MFAHSGLKKVSYLTVGSSRCDLTSLSTIQLTCRLQSSLSVGQKDVVVYFQNGGKKKFANGFTAGAYVLGQGSFTAAEVARDFSLSSVSGIANNGTKLVVNDALNSRLLMWEDLSNSSSVPTLVLGYDSLTATKARPGTYSSSLFSGVCITNGRMAASDYTNNRVFVWNSIPTVSNTAPDFVLGQQDFTGTEDNQGGSVAANTLLGPMGLYCDDSTIMVADYGNNRVLIWDGPISANNQNANRVIGQSDFTSSATNLNNAATLGSLSEPRDVTKHGNILAVSDTGNNRVLLYDYAALPATGAAAVRVLGQSNASNTSGATSSTRFRLPSRVLIDDDHLIVSDASNNRVGVWNITTDPLTTWADGRAMDFVLGQPDFTTNTSNDSGVTLATLLLPHGVTKFNGKFYVADYRNNRILIWNSVPTTTSESADELWGQASANTNNINDSAISGAELIGNTLNITTANGELIVSEGQGHVIKFFSPLTMHQQPYDRVWGQTALDQRVFNALSPTALSLRTVRGMHTASDGRFFVVDSLNHRLLIFNSPPLLNTTPPDNVLGQTNFTLRTSATSAAGLSSPNDVCATDSKIFVSDNANNRVLVWDTSTPLDPVVNGEAANLVLGQPDFVSSGANQNGLPSASTLDSPTGIYCDDTRLIVVDQDNHRVLIWNSHPTQNGQAADFVLGQADFTQNSMNQGLGTSSSTGLYTPSGVEVSNGHIFVTDADNNRILKWGLPITASGQAAAQVLGQSSFSENSCNRGMLAPDAFSLCYPTAIHIDGGRMYIGDTLNERVVVYPEL